MLSRAAPPVPGWSVRRQRLLAAIDHARQPMVVLRGGAGYGKTMLAAQWAAGQANTVWWDAGRAEDPIADLLALRALEPARLVIDHYRPTDPDADKLLASMIDDLPAGGRLLLLARAEPELRCARRILDGTALLLDADDLALARDEIAAFARNLAAELDDDRIEQIATRTRGWPAAVRVALHELVERGTLASLSGSLGPWCRYLETEAWNDVPPAWRRFMLCTAPLEELHPDWCAALAGTDAPVLRDLARQGLPVLPPEQVGQGYRYHPLYREFLLARLAEHPSWRRDLERAAARLLLDAKRPLDAAEHALAAEDWESAVECLAIGADQAFREGRSALLRRLLERFPEAWRERSELLRVEGYLAWAEGDLQVALAKAKQAAQTDDGELRADALVLTASVHYAKGDLEAEHTALHAAIAASPYSRRVQGKAWYALGSLHFRAGRLGEAEEALCEAAKHPHEGDALYTAVISQSSLLAMARGKPRAAAAGLERALTACHAVDNRRGEAHAHYHLALALNQAGMHQRALESLREGRRLTDQLGLAHLGALLARETADTLRDMGAAHAVEAYRSAIAALEAIGAESGLLHAYHGLSVYYRRRGDTAPALYAAEQSVAYAASGDIAFAALARTHAALLKRDAAEAARQLEAVLGEPQRYYQALALLFAASADPPRTAELAAKAFGIIEAEGFEHLLETERALVAPLLARVHGGAGGNGDHVPEPVPSAATQPSVRLHLLGRLEAFDTDGARVSVRPQALQLLAFLALRRGATVDSGQIVEALWYGQRDERRHVLQTLIWLLRHVFHPRIIVTRAHGYTFDPDRSVWVDVEAFAESAGYGRLQRAVDLYRGELLPGVEWADLERRHLENRYLSALDDLAAEHFERGRVEHAVALWEKVILLDPWAKTAYERLIDCHVAAGRDDAARRIRIGFRRMLEEAMDP